MQKADLIVLALSSAAMSSVTAPILPPEVALHWYCAAGAIMGAVAAAAMPTREEPGWRLMAWRLIGCAAAGFTLAPFIIRRYGLPADPETVLGASAGVGVAAWLAGRILSSMSTRELIDAALYIGTLGRFGKLPGDRNDPN